MEETLSLFQLNEYIKRVIALNFEFPVWVSAELSQVKQSRGHYYIDLIQKDEQSEKIVAQSSAVIWANVFWFLKKKLGDFIYELLRDGVELRLKVNVDFHERYGLKLIVEDLDASYTMGKLELARRQILETLRKKRLLEKNAALPLPAVIQRIAVLSSEKAAGFQDFLKQLEENAYDYQFSYTLYEVALQGDRAERDVVNALSDIGESPVAFDCVVIVRGGGARIDLAAFDNLAIGIAIANLPLPVITGIGHEIDQTVADLVAHSFCKTPTAVAELLIDHNAAFETEILSLEQSLLTFSRRNLQEAASSLTRLHDWLKQLPVQQFRNESRKLDRISELIFRESKSRVIRNLEKLDAIEKLIQSLHPDNTLKRGYSITTDEEGKIITSAKVLQTGSLIKTRLAEGKLESIIKLLDTSND